MTSAFFTLSMCELFQAFTMRSLKQNIFTLKNHNLALWGAMLFSLILGLLVIYVPALADIFSMKPLTARELMVSLGLAATVIPIIETVKFFQKRGARGGAAA
jgi:Ca2+-transporting ATPase